MGKKLLIGEGLYCPAPKAQIRSLREISANVRIEEKDRITLNNEAEKILEDARNGLPVNEKEKVGLSRYTGTCNLQAFYGTAIQDDYALPNHVINGIYKILSELSLCDHLKSICFINTIATKLLGILPVNLRERFNDRELEITAVSNNLKNLEICSLVYPGINYYHHQGNVLTNSKNIGISGYQNVVHKQHDIVVAQVGTSYRELQMIAATVEEGGILFLIAPFQLSDHFTNSALTVSGDNERKSPKEYLTDTLDVLDMKRMIFPVFMDSAGMDEPVDVIVFRKNTRLDELISNFIRTLPGSNRDVLIKVDESVLLKGVPEEMLISAIRSNELIKRIWSAADHLQITPQEFVSAVKSVMDRQAQTKLWMQRSLLSDHIENLRHRQFGEMYFQNVLAEGRTFWKMACAHDYYAHASMRQYDDSLWTKFCGLIEQHVKEVAKQMNQPITAIVSRNAFLSVVMSGNGKMVFSGDNSFNGRKTKEIVYRLIYQAVHPEATLSASWLVKMHACSLLYQGHDVKSQDAFFCQHGLVWINLASPDFPQLAKSIKKSADGVTITRLDPEVQMFGYLFQIADDVPEGTIIIKNKMVLRRINESPKVLLQIVEKTCRQNYELDTWLRLIGFKRKVTLEGVFSEAISQDNKGEVYIAELHNKIRIIATFADSARADRLTDDIIQIFQLGKKSFYSNITDEVGNDFGELKSTLRFIDELMTLRNEINAGRRVENHRSQLLKKVSRMLGENKIPLHQIPIIKKYLFQEHKPDIRYYFLQALSRLITDAAGNVMSTDKWKGILKAKIYFDPYDEIEDVPEFLNLVSLRPEYKNRIRVRELLSDAEELNGTGYMPTMLYEFSDIKKFIQQATETGEWIIDYTKCRKGEYLIRYENFAVGNIGKKLQLIKLFKYWAENKDIDTNFFHCDLAIALLEEMVAAIPIIPENSVDFSPHMNVINFEQHVLPWMNSMVGNWMVGKGMLCKDYTENNYRGMWKIIYHEEVVAIPGYSLRNVPVTKGMVIRYINNTPEIKALKNMAGEIQYKQGKKGMNQINIPDAELTSERNAYLSDKFNRYIREDMSEKMRAEIMEHYNLNYMIKHSIVEEDPIEIEGVNEFFRGKPFVANSFQNRGVRRSLRFGRIYLDHVVGSGKTITTLLALIEAKNRGLLQKACIVVPLNTILQWEEHIVDLFKNPKYIIVRTENKYEALADISVNDYDFIVMAASTFSNLMGLSAELKLKYLLEDLIPVADAEREVQNKLARLTYGSDLKKTLDSQAKTLNLVVRKKEAEIQDVIIRSVMDKIEFTFDRLGVDALAVDEKDTYKNLSTELDSYLQNVRGIRASESQVAMKMYHISKFVQDANNYRNRIDMSGTPVSNSATEIYHAIKGIAPDLLSDAGIRSFSEFVANHGLIESVEIVTPQNQIEARSTFAGLRNLNQLKRMIFECFDIVTQEEMDSIKRAQGEPIPIPKYQDHLFPSTPEKILISYYTQHLVAMLKQLAKMSPIEKAERTARKQKLNVNIKQLRALINVETRGNAGRERILELEDGLEELLAERRVLVFNSGVLYNQIRSGIVHTKLFHESIDDSTRENSKISKFAERSAESFLRTYDAPIVTIDGLDFYKLPGNELRCVTNGQLVFMDRMSRSDIKDFNAKDAYIKAVIDLLPSDIKNPERLFWCLDSDSLKPVNKKKMMSILASYYDLVEEENEVNEALEYFDRIALEKYDALKMIENDDGEMVPAVDEDGNYFVETLYREGKMPNHSDVAQYLYNHGKVRWLFGTTESMGVGRNLQYTTTDVHNIDMPLRPRDYRQRNGRAYRQGNRNTYIFIHTYSSQGGPEVILLQLLKMKENFIIQTFDTSTLNDFTNEFHLQGLATGDFEETSVFLKQLDNMIYATADKEIQAFVNERKTLEELNSKMKMFKTIIEFHQENTRRLDKYNEDIDKNMFFVYWMMYEIIPAIEAKIEEQEIFNQEYIVARKEAENNLVYATQKQQIETSYNPRIDMTTNIRERNSLIYNRDQQLHNLNSQHLPKRKYVEDFDLQFKISMLTKFPWAESFNWEIEEIFFRSTWTDFSKGKEQIHYTSVENLIQGKAPQSVIKRLVTSHDYNSNMEKEKYYYLGQLSRAIKNKIATVTKVMNAELKSKEELNTVLVSSDYLDSLDRAVSAINGDDKNKPLIDQIHGAETVIMQNQGAYFSFIDRQDYISTHAGYIVENILPGQNETERLSEIERFVEQKEYYESGQIDTFAGIL